jgi:CxxC-x17-CxxC domain-containing protein
VIMQDKTLKCRDCSAEFVFTAGEQEFFQQKGFTNEPTRCPSCRSANKASRGDSGGGFGRSRDREMFPAVCAQCGKATQVPFQPREDRPVYCSDCFSAQRQGGGGGYDRRPSSGGYGSKPGGDRSGKPGARSRDRGRDSDRW